MRHAIESLSFVAVWRRVGNDIVCAGHIRKEETCVDNGIAKSLHCMFPTVLLRFWPGHRGW